MVFIKVYYIFSIFNLAAGLFLLIQLLVGYRKKEQYRHYFLGFILTSIIIHFESIMVWSTWKTPVSNIVLISSSLIPGALYLLCKIFNNGMHNQQAGEAVFSVGLSFLILGLSFVPPTAQGIAFLLTLLVFGAQGFLLFKKRFCLFQPEYKRVSTAISLIWALFLPIVLLNCIPKLNFPKATALLITTGMNLQIILLLRLFLINGKHYETLFKVAKIKYQTNPLGSTNISDIKERLLLVIEVKKVYLDSELSLKSLSKLIQISPHQLSQVLNKEFGVNFNDFINFYRIDHACSLLQENPIAKILAVAYDSGFNNKNTFNMAFKKVTGKTPSQFAKTVKSQKTGQ